jgi:hypothetical protein
MLFFKIDEETQIKRTKGRMAKAKRRAGTKRKFFTFLNPLGKAGLVDGCYYMKVPKKFNLSIAPVPSMDIAALLEIPEFAV